MPVALDPRFPKAFDSTLPVMRLARANDDAGTNLALTLPDGRRASVFSDVRLMNSPKLGKQFKLLDGLLASSTATLIERNEAGYHGGALGVEKQTFVAKIVPVFRETISQTRTARAEHAARLTRTLDWVRAAEPNPVLRGDLRRWLLRHSVSERIGLLMRADYAVVVSALEIGQVVVGLDNAQWEAFLNHARAVIHIHKAGTAADFTLKPSVDNISASGIDHEAAYKNAQNMLDQMRERWRPAGNSRVLFASCCKIHRAFRRRECRKDHRNRRMKSAIFIAKPETTAAELAAVTGIYPQLAYYYRRTQSFPASRKGTYRTSELVKYLRKKGWEIELV